jgi:hypothetical protein
MSFVNLNGALLAKDSDGIPQLETTEQREPKRGQ